MVSVVGMEFASVYVMKTNPINVSLVLYKPEIHLNSSLKWLYINNRMEQFSYKGGCGAMFIDSFKRKLTLATYQQLSVISNTVYNVI